MPERLFHHDLSCWHQLQERSEGHGKLECHSSQILLRRFNHFLNKFSHGSFSESLKEVDSDIFLLVFLLCLCGGEKAVEGPFSTLPSAHTLPL